MHRLFAEERIAVFAGVWQKDSVTWLQHGNGSNVAIRPVSASYFKLHLFVHHVTLHLSSNHSLLTALPAASQAPDSAGINLFLDGFILLACATQMCRKYG